ncbi:MAG: hypothetical protein ISS48_02645 [Candidatus Aenigmarchaeota archaeon]|nr:hypothetical protein [Candidatus Aenigmarchaeota archaeon]
MANSNKNLPTHELFKEMENLVTGSLYYIEKEDKIMEKEEEMLKMSFSRIKEHFRELRAI